MKQANDNFYIWYNKLKAAVSVRYVTDRAEFLITVEDAAPIVVYRQISPKGRKEWVSTSAIAPEIALKLGVLIDNYLRSLAKKSKEVK